MFSCQYLFALAIKASYLQVMDLVAYVSFFFVHVVIVQYQRLSRFSTSYNLPIKYPIECTVDNLMVLQLVLRRNRFWRNPAFEKFLAHHICRGLVRCETCGVKVALKLQDTINTIYSDTRKWISQRCFKRNFKYRQNVTYPFDLQSSLHIRLRATDREKTDFPSQSNNCCPVEQIT